MFPMLIASLIFIVVVAVAWWFGFWNSTISTVNLIIASLIASSAYHTVANKIIVSQSSFIFLADFLAIWMVFILSFIVLRGLTDSLSGYRLKFDPMVEMVGRSVMAIWVAGVFTCFSMFTLQLAPLTPDFYGGRGSDEGTIPDRAWLAFVQSRSRGAFASSRSSNMIFPEDERPEHEDDQGMNCRVFDPFATYLTENDFRRIILSRNRGLRASQ